MIQRPQSLYILFSILLLVAVGLSVCFAGEIGGNDFEIRSYATQSPAGLQLAPAPAAFQVFALVLMTVSLFLYKRRPMQIRLLAISNVMVMFMLPLLAYLFYTATGGLELLATGIRTGTVLIMAVLILNLIAISLIRRDERTVRSMDRLR